MAMRARVGCNSNRTVHRTHSLRFHGKRVPQVLKEQKERLKERIDTLLADQGVELDDATVAREMALVADRSDIREELIRLAAHLDEFDKLLSNDDLARTLGEKGKRMAEMRFTQGNYVAEIEAIYDGLSPAD